MNNTRHDSLQEQETVCLQARIDDSTLNCLQLFLAYQASWLGTGSAYYSFSKAIVNMHASHTILTGYLGTTCAERVFGLCLHSKRRHTGMLSYGYPHLLDEHAAQP